jgi:Flp pilus assembly protein TadD
VSINRFRDSAVILFGDVVEIGRTISLRIRWRGGDRRLLAPNVHLSSSPKSQTKTPVVLRLFAIAEAVVTKVQAQVLGAFEFPRNFKVNGSRAPRRIILGQAILLLVSLPSLLMAQDIYQQAKTAFAEGRFGDAVSLLADLPEDESMSPEPYNLRALALAELGRYDEALAASQRAHEIDPRNANYVYNAGLIYLNKGDPRHAELVFREALPQFPQSALLYEGLGEVLLKLNRFGDAEVSLNRAAEISPARAAVYVVMARLHYAVGNGEKLGTAASTAIALDPGNYQAAFYYGVWLMYYQRQVKNGIDYIRRSIDLQPRFVQGLKMWGRIVSREGRWVEAVRTYEKAVAIDPRDDKLFYLLSVAYRRVGDDQKADWALAQYRRLAKP